MLTKLVFFYIRSRRIEVHARTHIASFDQLSFKRKIRSCSVNQTRVVHFTSNRKRIIEFFSEVPMFLLILGPGRNSNRHPSRKLSAHLPSTCKHLSPTFHKGLIIFRDENLQTDHYLNVPRWMTKESMDSKSTTSDLRKKGGFSDALRNLAHLFHSL
uniref:Uncharacterized protein n=1 Tax=Populus trichocarpa TaxID=3694 RepID=A0A3N7EU73_POPTR